MKNSKNPFLSGTSFLIPVIKKSDYSMYNQLYKFDVKSELNDYNLPFGDPEEAKNLKSTINKPMAISKISSYQEED
jgi:hypothetical protein